MPVVDPVEPVIFFFDTADLVLVAGCTLEENEMIAGNGFVFVANVGNVAGRDQIVAGFSDGQFIMVMLGLSCRRKRTSSIRGSVGWVWDTNLRLGLPKLEPQ